MPSAAADDCVTIYVASINTARSTELCIRSIARYTKRDRYRLHIGDGGSTDMSLPMIVSMLRRGVVDNLELAPRGRSHGDWLDLWTAQSPTRYAAFVDSDIEILSPSWLKCLVDCASQSKAAVVCAEILPEIERYVDHTGVGRRLAARPSAWMVLVDTERCRGRASWKFAIEAEPSVPDRQVGFDTGARLMRDLEDACEVVVEAPEGFCRMFRHYGGMSWVKTTKRSGWRSYGKFVKVSLFEVVVRFRLARIRSMSWSSHAA